MINKNLKLILIYLAFWISSCSSYKNIPYFQNLDYKISAQEEIKNFSPINIQPGDILGINVASLNMDAAAIFNYNLNRVNGNSNYINTTNNPVIGYLVDQKGEIQLPLIGTIQASGLTTTQLREKIKPKLVPYLKEAVINVRILNFRISVFGDVLKPDTYTIENERITLPEALSLAGDLNITALRTNVLLLREQDGQRQYIPIDLTKKDLFNSPYYYLKSNDVIYVQPGRSKFGSVNNSYRNLSLFLSALSIVAIIITR